MTNFRPMRRALPIVVAVLATGSTLSSSSVLAATSTNSVTYIGPTLDELRVVVQVSIVVRNKKIINVRSTVYVRTARSHFINTQVLPLLRQEVLQAQSANIQLVSGATITSRAYVTSLQAALRPSAHRKGLLVMKAVLLETKQPETDEGLHLVPSPPVRSQPRSRQWTARFIKTIFFANILIIVGLWVKGGNVATVHTEGGLFASLGRITGLLAAYFLLVQVLLLARMPFLQALTGFDRLTLWHRWNGRFTLLLILGHVTCITMGYALLDRLSVIGETVSLLTKYPGMVQALIGTVLVLMVGVTSAVIVRRRLRYETWYVVHLTAYLAVFLTWFHQIPNGNELVLRPIPTAYWTALYVVTLQLVVVFRVIQPLVRGAWHGMRVTEVIHEGPGVVSVRMAGRHLDWMDVHAGQFFLWRFLAPGMWRQSHPFSLSAAPQRDSLRITVKSLGDFSTRVAEIKPGTWVMAEGPFGSFTGQARRHKHAVLIAAGIGITPIRALLEEMTGPVTLIYRARNERELIFRHELDRLARDGTTVHYVVGDRSVPEHRHFLTAPHLRQLVPDIAHCDVYLCGPSGMMRPLQRTLRRIGVAKSLHSCR